MNTRHLAMGLLGPLLTKCDLEVNIEFHLIHVLKDGSYMKSSIQQFTVYVLHM